MHERVCLFSIDPEKLVKDMGKRREERLSALVAILKLMLTDFEALYDIIIKDGVYADCTSEAVMKYYKSLESN